AAVGGPAADALGGVSGGDARADAALGGPLQVHVERQPDRLAWDRRELCVVCADRPSQRVHAKLGGPILAPEVDVVARLDTALSDVVAQVVALATVDPV